MRNIQAVTPERHINKRWQRYTSYGFAAGDVIAPLVVQELPQAAMAMPVAFVAAEHGFEPVAVLGLKAGKNLFIAADGTWIGTYVPAAYRAYPFALAGTADGQQILCIDEDSGLLSDSEGEAFLGDNGQPSPAVRQMLDFLAQVAENREATRRICSALKESSLFQPWPIKVQVGSAEQVFEGLYRIDEAALNQLSADAFERIRQAGGLPVAYCQLLSMQHLPMLGKMAQAHAQVAQQPPGAANAGAELGLDFLSGPDTITFGNGS